MTHNVPYPKVGSKYRVYDATIEVTQDDDRSTPVRLIAHKDTVLSICECGEETAGPNFCGYCGHPIEWDNGC